MSQAPKKDKKDEDEEDKAFKEKQKQDAAAIKAAKDKGVHYISASTFMDSDNGFS
jgi:hypothetical protein